MAVDYGCLADFDRYMDECGLRGRRVVLYDTNTYNLPGMVHVRADKEIVLEARGLHSEKGAIEAVMPQLEGADVIITVGSGTLMDFARYPAYKLGVPFVAIPTLASSDGFTANICSVVVDGQKESIPMKAPRLVVADLNIISKAPQHLLVSGVADILAKYISLADWRIAKHRLRRVLLSARRRRRPPRAEAHGRHRRPYAPRLPAGLPRHDDGADARRPLDAAAQQFPRRLRR